MNDVNMTYSMFASIETEMRRYLQEHNEPNSVNILRVEAKMMENDVLFDWSMVSAYTKEQTLLFRVLCLSRFG